MSTIQDLFDKGKFLLKNSPDPSLDARLLVCKSLEISDEVFFSHPEYVVTDAQKNQFAKLLRMRKRGIPLAYVLEEKEFWSLPFKVFPGVLIPRPETELLVDKVIALSRREKQLIIDIGTGVGNIAVALAHELPHARIIATDISSKALNAARTNAFRLKTSSITFICGSLFSPLSEQGLEKECDIIVSNPPYVSETEWGSLQDSIRLHEPPKALVAGRTGLEVLEKLIRGAPAYLKKDGYLCLEFGFGQKNEVLKLFGERWTGLEVHEDLSGIPRVITAQWTG